MKREKAGNGGQLLQSLTLISNFNLAQGQIQRPPTELGLGLDQSLIIFLISLS